MYNLDNQRGSRKAHRHLGRAACLFASLMAATALAQTTTRPISDFVNGQHTYGTYFIVAWQDPTNHRYLFIDYAGKMNQYIVTHGGTDLGTTISGTILERPLSDGKAEVTVILHIENGLTFASQTTASNYVFGHTPLQVAAGADPALGSINFQFKFTNSAPGAPIPDLVDIIFLQGTEGFNKLNAIARGTFRGTYGVPDGTPGFVQSTDVGVLQSKGSGGPRGDFFPAEHIDFHVNGH